MARGLVMDVRLTCSCGVEFVTTKANRLGLCPACAHEHSLAVERARKVAYRERDRDRVAVGVVRGPERAMRSSREASEYVPSGPVHGFAQLGSLYGANDGRLLGRRIRMDLMQVPHGRRPKKVLVRDGR